jgi:dihydrofolate reductase
MSPFRNVVLIAAIDSVGGIGKKNQLLVSVREDLLRFRDLTTPHVVIMGRKTYESLGKPLQHRRNIVITRKPNALRKRLGDQPLPAHTSCEFVSTLDAAFLLAEAWAQPWDPIWVIGGASVYEQSLERATHLALTHIEGDFDADAYFPAGYKGMFRLVSSSLACSDGKGLIYEFRNYVRIQPSEEGTSHA